VSDLLAFDPLVRRDREGNNYLNLAFRTEPRSTGRAFKLLDEIAAQAVPELRLHWNVNGAAQSLTMFNANVLMHKCAYLSQQGQGRNYDEFGLVVESTHGNLRRADATGPANADYWVTPEGLRWERRLASA